MPRGRPSLRSSFCALRRAAFAAGYTARSMDEDVRGSRVREPARRALESSHDEIQDIRAPPALRIDPRRHSRSPTSWFRWRAFSGTQRSGGRIFRRTDGRSG
jgi:hypothetical protein